MRNAGGHFALLPAIMALTIGVSSSRAMMYECMDSAGGRIYTDTRAQLSHCLPIAGTVHSPGGVAPPLAPGPIMSDPAAAGAPPAPDRDIGPPPVLQEAAGPVPGEGASAQRCASAINPFNPLMTQPCPPPLSAGNPQPSPADNQPASRSDP